MLQNFPKETNMTATLKLQISAFGTLLKQPFSVMSTINSENEDTLKYSQSKESIPTTPDALISTSIARDEDLPKYSLTELLYHDSSDDCWVAIYDRVYDITNFLYTHPGGFDVILEYAGRDATVAFRSSGHSKMAEAALEPYLIGILQEKDRIWTRFRI